MTNYNDGKWHAHRTNETPEGLNLDTIVETYRVDMSTEYLPEGMGSVFQWHTSVDETPWENPPYNMQITAFRVVKEHKEPQEFWICPEDEGIYRHDPKTYGYIHVREVLDND